MTEGTIEKEIKEQDECPYCGVRVRNIAKHKEIQHQSIDLETFLKDSKWTLLTTIFVIPGLIIRFYFQDIILLSFPFYKILLSFGMIFGGFPLVKEGLKELIEEHHFDVDSLVVIAAIGAVFINYWEEAGVLILLFNVAESLEDFTVFKARGTIKKLMDVSPDTARVRRGIQQKMVPINEVEQGETIVVRPGERVPLDGEITKGDTSIDESPVTGESMPVTKHKSDKVYAGTLNKEGLIEIKVKGAGSSTLTKVIELIEEASRKKSPTEKLVNRISKYYTPIVLILAILVTLVPVLVFNQSFQVWFYKSLVLLVISCPCAFVISTPVSMISAISNSARKGVLIKGGKFIEQLKDIDVFYFDKTGTLTKGEPEVTDLIPLKISKNQLLIKATALEQNSNHPLAEAIRKKHEKENLKKVKASHIKAKTGFGLEGRINGEKFRIGSPDFFEEVPNKVKDLQEEGKTCIILGNQEEILGMIGIRDEIRSEAKQVIRSLKDMGKKTVMLTGDNRGTASAIAKELEIDNFKAELLPEDKIRYIEEDEEERRVAMIGDGINDAPALTRASVGIAMGAAGTDTAIESSDIALMQNDLTKIIYLIKISAKTNTIIKQNVTLSIGIKVLMAILSLPGFITLWMAVGFGDAGMALLVTLNALRILKA